MTGIQLKQFVSKRFGIPQSKIRAQVSKRFCEVRFVPEPSKSHRDPTVYAHRFPAAFGNLCMRTVYKSSESLCQQNWGGNISNVIVNNKW